MLLRTNHKRERNEMNIFDALFGWLIPASRADIFNLKEQIMATKQEVLDAVAAESAEVATRINELLAEIQRLNDLIAAGGAVTAADLDELKAAVEAIFTAPPPVVP